MIVVDGGPVYYELPDELLICTEDGACFVLDNVGAYIWKMIQKPRSFAELVALITSEFDVDDRQCEQDLLDILRDLEAHGLINVKDSVKVEE
jgi:hypothetical protein